MRRDAPRPRARFHTAAGSASETRTLLEVAGYLAESQAQDARQLRAPSRDDKR